MAEDPKITLDAPPWEPVDVEVSPDGPPWQPHDVETFPDAAPWDPVEVPLYPDGLPWDPVQVPTYPDGPPAEPFDVKTQLDPAPWDPVDVPTSPDPAPWEPTDVQVVADPLPWEPQVGQTAADPAPWQPVDVPTIPSGQPWAPVDVPILLDEPGPLSEVIPVRDHRTPPPYTPVDLRGSGELSDRLRRYDAQLANFLDDVGQFVPFVSKPGAGAFDPLVLANWFRNYKDSVGVGGIAKFITEQSVLYAMNTGPSRVFDPSYFARLLVPGMTGMFNTHVDLVSQADITRAQDEVLKAHVAVEPPVGARDNIFDPTATYSERQDFTVDEMVDARTEGTAPKLTPYMSEDRETGVARFDASKYFEPRDSFGAQKIRGTTKANVRAGIGPDVGSSKLARSAALNGIIRVGVPGEGEPIPGGSVAYGGVVLSQTPIPSVDDDDVRLPLCFTDLRKDPTSDAYRHVYFQPENLTIGQSFSPQYNETQGFGRVDQMVGYIGTTRTWSVSFEVHAFAPEDLRTMYEKMTWLTAMVYPTYGHDALMRSGPVARMRIGDVAATSEGGLPGVIRNLNFDFADCLWELKRGMKVPRSYAVQLDYTVLHDGPVGIIDGMFGVLSLPSGPSTNLAGTGPAAPNQAAQDNGPPDQATLATGRWARFGEPSRKG